MRHLQWTDEKGAVGSELCHSSAYQYSALQPHNADWDSIYCIGSQTCELISRLPSLFISRTSEILGHI